MSEKDQDTDHRPEPRVRILAFGGVMGFVLALVFSSVTAELGRFLYFRNLLRDHFTAIVGLPSAAVASFFIVATLRQASGPIEIETAGFKLKGASGPILLWVVCFLAMAAAIKLVW